MCTGRFESTSGVGFPQTISPVSEARSAGQTSSVNGRLKTLTFLNGAIQKWVIALETELEVEVRTLRSNSHSAQIVPHGEIIRNMLRRWTSQRVYDWQVRRWGRRLLKANSHKFAREERKWAGNATENEMLLGQIECVGWKQFCTAYGIIRTESASQISPCYVFRTSYMSSGLACVNSRMQAVHSQPTVQPLCFNLKSYVFLFWVAVAVRLNYTAPGDVLKVSKSNLISTKCCSRNQSTRIFS